MLLLTDVEKRYESGFNLLQLLCILLIGISQSLESTGRIYVVSWINTHLFSVKRSHVSHFRVEMNICNEWRIIAIAAQFGVDRAQILGFPHALCGQTYEFSTCFNDSFGLCHAAISIIRVGGCHRLHSYRIVSADPHSPHPGYG